WTVGDAWTVGVGATAWGLFGRDADPWLAGAAPSWSLVGGGLVASVATR
ncbi:MAG: hypothetical protein JWM10_5318, partial [Myxococcaceae bacterium]|nr:hypothetical protein [Myxococcaceae bacterium]